MEIICRFCQGAFEVDYKNVFRIDEDYFVTYCPGCYTENEVWDVYDWFDQREIDYIKKYNNEDEKGSSEGGCLSDDNNDEDLY